MCAQVDNKRGACGGCDLCVRELTTIGMQEVDCGSRVHAS